MHIFLAIIASALWLFLSGAIEYVVILPDFFKEHFGHITRDPKALPLWAVVAEKLLQGLGLVLLLLWSSAPALRLSAIPLLLVSATYLFSTYANYKVPGRPVLLVTVIDAVRVVIGLLISALILGHPFS